MATGNKRNYSILVGVELDTSNIQQQLDELVKKGINIDLNINGKDEVKGVTNSLKDFDETAQKADNGAQKVIRDTQSMGLTFQQANDIMQKSIDIIGSMLDSVFELDGALVEFRKVSDLAGSSLDAYVNKLTQMGLEVGRTGSEMVSAAT